MYSCKVCVAYKFLIVIYQARSKLHFSSITGGALCTAKDIASYPGHTWPGYEATKDSTWKHIVPTQRLFWDSIPVHICAFIFLNIFCDLFLLFLGGRKVWIY